MGKKLKTNTRMNPKVDEFLGRAKQWREEFTQLRAIALACGVTEELKWKHPCYTVDGKNIVLIHGFKEYCALLFFKGVLMKDPKKILIQQTEHVQGPRQVRFTRLRDITALTPVLKGYIHNAIEVEKAGLKVVMKKTAEFKVPEELRAKLESNPVLKKAFETLTPGRQRAYLYYFSQAKQSQTREIRIEKCVQWILSGKGLDD